MGDQLERKVGRHVSIEELIALNDEIVALTRAGMPLERGLVDVSSDLPGRLRRITEALGKRMNEGESLSEALASSGHEVPPVYRAVVEAGIRSGRLPMALEGLATYCRGYVEGRRAIGLALWYPLLVLTLAYGLFIFIATMVIPRFMDAFESLGLPVHRSLSVLDAMGRTSLYWGPILPLILVLLTAGWVVSRRATALGGGAAPGYRLLFYFPWMGSMMRGFEAASFADLLALLVEHKVPYPEALLMAGEASGDASLARSSRALAESIRGGMSTEEALRGESFFPPLLRWLLATAPRQADLAASLKQMANRYRSNARHQAAKIRLVLPTILLFGIGATATLLYALALFVPMTSLWQGLANVTP